MSKHTPGPWEAFTQPEFSGWWAVRDASTGREIGSCDGGFDETDARLMAAAPELLAAMQASIALADMSRDAAIALGREVIRPPKMQAAYDACVAAVAKAIGDVK